MIVTYCNPHVIVVGTAFGAFVLVLLVGVRSTMAAVPNTSAALPHTSLRMRRMASTAHHEPIIGTRGVINTTFQLLRRIKWRVLPMLVAVGAVGAAVSSLTPMPLKAIPTALVLLLNLFAVGAVFFIADDAAAGEQPRSAGSALRASLEFMPRISAVGMIACAVWVVPVYGVTSAFKAGAWPKVFAGLWLATGIWFAPLVAMAIAVVVAEDLSGRDAIMRASLLVAKKRIRFFVVSLMFWLMTMVVTTAVVLLCGIAPKAVSATLISAVVALSMSGFMAANVVSWYVMYLQALQTSQAPDAG
jgi:hypothetical protein